jgi:cell volume regulation protein A
LALLLRKIKHHIKFAPIILLVILIYAVSKVYHLPGLVFILLFGLFLGNVDQLKKFVWMEKFNPDALQKEVHKFKELTGEGAFLVRALFFMLFGFLIEPQEILNAETMAWSAGIVAGIFVLRAIQLKLFSLPIMPLLFIAPRGLITVLLFLAIEPSRVVFPVNNSLIIQVVLLTALMMMPGLLMSKQGKH